MPALTAALLLAGCGGEADQYSRELLRGIDQGKVVGTRGTMETIGRALSAYAVDRGGYPPAGSAQDAAAALTPAFLRSPIVIDTWGNALLYQSNGASFTLTSTGADGAAGTDDDLVMVDGRFTRMPAPRAP